MKNPKMFPTFDFDDQKPTKLPSAFTLKQLLNIVIKAGKKENWQNPNSPNPTIKNKYVAMPGLTMEFYP